MAIIVGVPHGGHKKMGLGAPDGHFGPGLKGFGLSFGADGRFALPVSVRPMGKFGPTIMVRAP